MVAHVHVDANVVIRLFESYDEKLRRFVERLMAEKISICTSELTLTEVLVIPLRDKAFDLVSSYEDFLTDGRGVSILPVDRNILRRAAEIRAELGTRTPDAIHIASALTGGCRLMVSSDRRLKMPTDLRRVAIEDLDGVAI